MPPRVRATEVPPELIEIHPEWRGHQYFVVRDEIVIVDRSRRVVGVVPVGSSRAEHRGTRASDRGSGPSARLSREEIRRIQMVLKERGVYNGEPDGVWSPEAIDALTQTGSRSGCGQLGVRSRRRVPGCASPRPPGLQPVEARPCGHGC